MQNRVITIWLCGLAGKKINGKYTAAAQNIKEFLSNNKGGYIELN